MRRASDPASADALRTLTEEHQAIEVLLRAVDRGVAALPAALRNPDLAAAREQVVADLTTLRDAVVAHLDHEEATAFAAGREHVPTGDWSRVERDKVQGLTLRDVSTLMPRILQNADPAGRARMLGRLPGPLRVLVTGVFEPRYRAMQRALPSHPRLPY